MQSHIFKTRESIFVVGSENRSSFLRMKANTFFYSQRGYLREKAATVCCGQMSFSKKPYKLKDSGHHN